MIFLVTVSTGADIGFALAAFFGLCAAVAYLIAVRLERRRLASFPPTFAEPGPASTLQPPRNADYSNQLEWPGPDPRDRPD